MLGETVSHFRLTEKLGEGAMGEVFLAEDLRLRRPVAIKMIATREAAEDDAADRLVREARVASALNHPNIAVIYEVGETVCDGEKRTFIAMEYVAGRTLAALGRRLQVAEVLGVVRQVADALAEAHDRGVVHRDVKPGNVMLTDSGRAKVLDFGLAKYVAPSGDETATWSGRHRGFETPGALLGTLAYMSPEQARGEEIDARSDVFSLGIVLYELLAGRRPFTGSDRGRAACLHPPGGAGAAAPRRRARCARSWSGSSSQMLAKDRDRRPASMREVLERIEAVAAGRARTPVSPREERTVAVMSFANITRPSGRRLAGHGDRGDGGRGSQVRARLVGGVARSGSSRCCASWAAGTDEAVAVRLGREVGAGLVVSGGYQRAGEQVRATARLTDTDSGTVLQTLKADGRMDEIFALQDRIVSELSAGLRLRVPAAGRERRRDAEPRGLRGLQQGSPELPDRDVGVARPRHPLLRARGGARPRLRACPRGAGQCATT